MEGLAKEQNRLLEAHSHKERKEEARESRFEGHLQGGLFNFPCTLQYIPSFIRLTF